MCGGEGYVWEWLHDLSLKWYTFLTQLGTTISEPILNLTGQWNLPILTAFLLGLAATTSPCQVTTNASALAYVSRDATNRKQTFLQLFGFILGKTLVYALIGGTAIYLGVQLTTINGNTSILVWIRKLIGPLMILTGFYFLGVFRSRISFGLNISEWLKSKMPHGTIFGSLGFGSAFALAFCPTLVWLFFGILVPLGIESQGGFILPIFFAIGSTTPLVFFVVLLVNSSELLKESVFKGTNKLNRWLTKIAAIIFLLAGLNDTFTYWFL